MKETAQTEYGSALDGMLSPQQRKTLQTLQRGSEDAQIHLNGQQIGQRIRDAQAGKGPGETIRKEPRRRNCCRWRSPTVAP